MRVFFSIALLLAAAPARASDNKYYYEDIFAPFFVKDDAAGVYRSARPGAAPASFPIRKAPGTFRVFVLGGSIAQRAMSGPQNLGDALRAALPKLRIEAVPCGMSGYDSYREALVLEEALEHEPDLVVLMSGHNEAAGSPPVPLWLLHAQDRLSRLSAYRALRGRWAYPSGERRRDEAAFKANLEQMAARAAAARVPLLLVVPPLNYSGAPPETCAECGRAPFLDGWLDLVRGSTSAAAARWSSAAADHDGETLFWRARLEERSGRFERARADFAASVAADQERFGRCGPACQRIIREASRTSGAQLADVDSAFLKAAAPRSPGLDMFADAVHWHDRWNGPASLAMLEALRGAPALRRLPWDEKRLARLEARWSKPARATKEDEAAAIVSYAAVSIEKAQGAFSWRALIELERVAELRPRWFASASGLLARAAAAGPGAGAAWGQEPAAPSPGLMRWHRGVVLLLRGDSRAAAEELGRAAVEEPAAVDLRLDWATALALAGRREQALREVDGARSFVPPDELAAYRSFVSAP